MTIEMKVITFEKVHCANCAIIFCVTDDFLSRRKNDGKKFHCPNGHGNSYQKTDIAKLKEELEGERRLTQYYRQQTYQKQAQLSATKGQLTKIKNRVAHGVCPCCNRSFQNLANHMKSQHPHFKDTENTDKAMTTLDAIKKMANKEFAVGDVVDFLKENGVKRNYHSVYSSISQLHASHKISLVRGEGSRKVFELAA